jgi:hypothetical protein
MYESTTKGSVPAPSTASIAVRSKSQSNSRGPGSPRSLGDIALSSAWTCGSCGPSGTDGEGLTHDATTASSVGFCHDAAAAPLSAAAASGVGVSTVGGSAAGDVMLIARDLWRMVAKPWRRARPSGDSM